jgi:hypothetical protein
LVSLWELGSVVEACTSSKLSTYTSIQDACATYTRQSDDRQRIQEAFFPSSHQVTPLIHGEACKLDLQTSLLIQLHQPPLQLKLMKDNQWEPDTYRKIDWEAYGKAIKRFPRSHHISITKLSHQLWHTNRQARKFYVKSAICPLCQKEDETLQHVYMCQSTVRINIRNSAQDTLEAELTKQHTSRTVKDTILTNIPGSCHHQTLTS